MATSAGPSASAGLGAHTYAQAGKGAGAGGEQDTGLEDRELASFEKADVYLRLLRAFVPGQEGEGEGGKERVGGERACLESEEPRAKEGDGDGDGDGQPRDGDALLGSLTEILDEYQEQSYLLDPFLEAMVLPPVRALQRGVRKRTLDPASDETSRLARLLYFYTKVRGYKTITRFFPHEVDDLLPNVFYLERLAPSLSSPRHAGKEKQQEQQIGVSFSSSFPFSSSSSASAPSPSSSCWELRYVLLLWLSLVCMIPFDLGKFDDSPPTATTAKANVQATPKSTASRIEAIGKAFMASPGKERDAAAVMLGKLFQRRDTSSDRFGAFLNWCRESLADRPSSFLATGILQTLCEVVKTSDATFVLSRLPAIHGILDMYDQAGSQDLRKNSLVNKYQTKLACRLGLKLLRPRKVARYTRAKVLSDLTGQLAASGPFASLPSLANPVESQDEDEEDVPEEVDAYITKLIEALQNKDTVVRYSAAKGLARLCERLPPSFIDQVCDAVVGLFPINVVDILGTKSDLSAVSEHSWQGACLALAELARRGLLAPDGLDETVGWVQKALFFDVRRGAHSVGSGVRDAACYVVWAFARAHDSEAMQTHALGLAQRLVTVSLLDREISIRRAASAAFQECVGRLGLFPHGIDIIRKTDFYAVSVRRNSFLDCVPQVAMHTEYREFILDHLLNVTTVHSDQAMRELGSASVAKVAELNLEGLGPGIVRRMTRNCSTAKDSSKVHGSLLTLAEVGMVCSRRADETASEMQVQIFRALDSVPLSTFRTLGAGLVLQAACELIAASVSQRALAESGAKPAWETIVNLALARQEENVHEAVAGAMAAGWTAFSTSQHQSNARVLGSLDYQTQHGEGFSKATRFLLELVDSKSARYSPNIETRRNAYSSLVSAVTRLGTALPTILEPNLAQDIIHSLVNGLEDYTTDQRGDVGSWVRLASIAGLRHIIDAFRAQASQLRPPESWLPPGLFHSIVGGVTKQLVERIDTVRADAGEHLLHIYRSAPVVDIWIPENVQLVLEVFPRGEESKFKEPTWLFPRAVRLLEIKAYRQKLLSGLVLSIGSKTEMAYRVVGTSLADYALDESQTAFGAADLIRELLALANANFASNRMFVPALQALNLLLEAGVADRLEDADAALQRMLRISVRNITKVKSVQRVTAAMSITVNLLAVESLRQEALRSVVVFLSHPFPTVRSATSEQIYMVLQDHIEIPEEAEGLLIGTVWSDRRDSEEDAKRLVTLLAEA